MAKSKKKRGFYTYKTYTFITKDPIIDKLRDPVSEYLGPRGYSKITQKGGPSASTLYAWFEGNTRRPQFCTVAATAAAIGAELTLTLPNGTKQTVSKPRATVMAAKGNGRTASLH